MQLLVERCAGLDVHRDVIVACARMPGKGRTRVSETESFSATTAGLRLLRAWLVEREIIVAGMESTGVYWRPVHAALEDVVECQVLNAGHLRRVPGRKTDMSDAKWICQITEHGLVQPSFVPPAEIRRLRALTRYRKTQIEERTREVQRLDKVLQDAGIKLGSVATDILGRSGRDMLAGLAAGTTDPVVLADLARGLLRKKIPALVEALEGRFGVEHRLLVASILAKIDYCDEAIAAMSAHIDEAAAGYEHHVEMLATIPGVGRRTAQCLIAEIGIDMAQFGTAGRLSSWAGMCPGNNESGGKRRVAKTRHGSRWLGIHLAEAAQAAGRTDTYLGAQYRRLRARRGPSKATKAVAHSIIVAAFHMLSDDVPYRDLGADWFDRRRPEARARRLSAQLTALGYTVRLDPISAA
jgi:transposase